MEQPSGVAQEDAGEGTHGEEREAAKSTAILMYNKPFPLSTTVKEEGPS